MTTALFFIAIGLYLIFHGLISDYLIDESEGLASEEQKERAKATPFTRLIVICAGIASSGWGIHHLLH
jgi:hypothetical protein